VLQVQRRRLVRFCRTLSQGPLDTCMQTSLQVATSTTGSLRASGQIVEAHNRWARIAGERSVGRFAVGSTRTVAEEDVAAPALPGALTRQRCVPRGGARLTGPGQVVHGGRGRGVRLGDAGRGAGPADWADDAALQAPLGAARGHQHAPRRARALRHVHDAGLAAGARPAPARVPPRGTAPRPRIVAHGARRGARPGRRVGARVRPLGAVRLRVLDPPAVRAGPQELLRRCAWGGKARSD
jgi:hypothetical protein